MNRFSSAKAIWLVILIIGTFVEVSKEIKRVPVRKKPKAAETNSKTTPVFEEMKAPEKAKAPGKGEAPEIPMRVLEEIGDLEEAYMMHLQNSTTNKTLLWPDAKKMERQNKLAAMCNRAHFLHGGNEYDLIEQAKVTDGTLHFLKKWKKKLPEPMRINVVKYKSEMDDKYYYLAKGMKATCVCYLQPMNDSKNDYTLSEYIQEVPMPTL